MKRLMFAGLLVLIATSAQAQGAGSSPNSHPGVAYTTLGPAGAGGYRSGTQRDSYRAAGNTKPNTGAVGSRNPRY